MNPLKIALIILGVLLYWKFIYYKYHTKPITPFLYFSVGGLLTLYGIWLFFIQKTITTIQIIPIYATTLIFLIVSFYLVVVAVKKHKLKKEIDITLTWAKKNFNFLPYEFWMIISAPAIFFIMISTYYLLGEEHITLWAMILLAWIFSNYKLTKNYLSK